MIKNTYGNQRCFSVREFGIPKDEFRFFASKKETRTQTKTEKKPKPIDHIKKCGLYLASQNKKSEKN
jgi:hypothetical protein